MATARSIGGGGTSEPPWSQPGVTDVARARAFLDALRSPDLLLLASSDGDVGYALTARNQRFRGHGVCVGQSVLSATPPPADLVAYHRSLGLGPEQVFSPAAASERARLARLVLEDEALCARIRADRSLARILVSFKDRAAETLIARLGLAPAYCGPPSAVYERANDKLAFAEAGVRYGFATVPTRLAPDREALDAAFRDLAEPYGAGCVVRLRRGAGGDRVHRARTLRAARRLWHRLGGQGDVLVASYVPPARVLRNVGVHGLLYDDGFAPLLFTDQLIREPRFRGSAVVRAWEADEIAAVRSTLGPIARWLADLGYADAPAGIDGFLVREPTGLRFLGLDPNVRLTGTMLPWAAVATLSEAAGRRFVWQFEWCSLFGRPQTLARMRDRLGADLLDPGALERGGVLPTFIASSRLGPIGATGLWAIFLAHDADHLARLRARVRALALIAR